MLGVLGGMGPVATADFFDKLLEEAGADCDEDHVPVLLLSDPRVPRRPAAILDGGESPLPRLRALRDLLIDAGASFLAMPCNTAHHWYPALVRDCPVPFISIVDASMVLLPPRATSVGLIATAATLQAGIYARPLAARGCGVLQPVDTEQGAAVLPAIARVKAGDAVAAGRLLEPVIESLLARGADAVLLACTETPIALHAIGSPLAARCIDTTRALARACVQHWRSCG